MRDGLSYPMFVLRTGLRCIRDLDGWISQWTSRLFPTEYVVQGHCRRRGVCCRQIAVAISPKLWRFGWLLHLIRRYYRFVYFFSSLPDDRHHHVLLFKCNYLGSDGQCTIYKRRPPICRRYPQPRYFGKPVFLPGCGYFAVKAAPQSEPDSTTSKGTH